MQTLDGLWADRRQNSSKLVTMMKTSSPVSDQQKEQKDAVRKHWNKFVIDNGLASASSSSPPAPRGVVVSDAAKYDIYKADKRMGNKLVETLRTMQWPSSGRIGLGWVSPDIKEWPRWTYSHITAAKGDCRWPARC